MSRARLGAVRPGAVRPGMTTVLVEPDPFGHRFQAVAEVAAVAARSGTVVLLTSTGARGTEWFRSFLAGLPIEVVERYDGVYPPTREMARGVAEVCRGCEASTVVVMDGDASLKRWWYAAAFEFRRMPNRPRVVFMLTRYIARLRFRDYRDWCLRTSKASLVLLAMATRTLHRAAGFAGRDELSTGMLVKRLRDPAVNTAHSRDRARLRRELGLPSGRRIVGIVGAIDARKSVPLLYEATLASAEDADLLVAGPVSADVEEWLAGRPADGLSRMILRRRHLDNAELDQLVAACDVVSVVQLNKGPSGIMGKALAAQVPVLTGGSKVRAREVAATRGGLDAQVNVASLATALRRLYEWDASAIGTGRLPPATAEAFAQRLLGVEADGMLPMPAPGNRVPARR